MVQKGAGSIVCVSSLKIRNAISSKENMKLIVPDIGQRKIEREDTSLYGYSNILLYTYCPSITYAFMREEVEASNIGR